ncbi:Clavaminate synthase-like protein [Yamadazyma tenuis ATCC 10573]|uniref:Clavaminate synthase-like protein n=2 Tax=Candida tenuis TaxID=2315449 RepID=G3B7K4_CANTC|nr:Clavaminate synthase-like protein [Yamadazyma tenuis ATCC 10573]EGV61636.1 Clavaminate synthase-like protein [Yamadazyma tenuis ATCC 10573]
MSFNEIPSLDLSLALDPSTKPQFLQQLRYALIDVGFLLLKNYESVGPSPDDFQSIKHQTEAFFRLPQSVKDGCSMLNSRHFLGYNKLANEITSKHTDWREQVDLANELPAPGADEPIYRNIEGPNEWPDASHIPEFKPVVLNYISNMNRLATVFRKLVCEALEVPADSMDGYFKPNQQTKMKIVAYPDVSQLKQESSKSNVLDDDFSTGQGCGPHRDSDLLTYIFQVTNHQNSLQVQNFQGKWITVPFIPNTLVVNVGQTLEAITQGVCKATIHRVVIPEPGTGTRISVPFFQTIDLDSKKSMLDNIPARVLQLKEERDAKIKDWAVDTGFQFTPEIDKYPVGHYVFRNRIKSHQDVAAKWYPDILQDVLSSY